MCQTNDAHHVQRVQLREPVGVRRRRVPAVALVRPDLAFVPHVVEVLLRVTVRLGRYPRRGVRRGPSALRLVVVDPLRAQRDRVFDLRVIRVRARRATSGWS